MRYFKKAFIVENNKLEASDIKKVLGNNKQIRYKKYFTNGLRAIQELKKNAITKKAIPDFIIIGLNTAIINSCEFLSEIIKLEILNQIPIFINASDITMEKYVQLKKYNITGFFVKKFDDEDLKTILFSIDTQQHHFLISK